MPVVYVYSVTLAVLLVAAAVLVHLQALRFLSAWQQRLRASGHLEIVLIIFGLITAHIVETAIFAFGYWIGERGLALGSFVGARSMTVLDYFYFSLETYTTQGVGDVYPIGPLRLVASLEPLAGLILIGWSVSFTFLVMSRQVPALSAVEDGAPVQRDTD